MRFQNKQVYMARYDIPITHYVYVSKERNHKTLQLADI
jgi:hypothetical protein